jgi:hypothetical protein
MMAKLVRIMWVPVLIATLYVGWIFWQRHGFRSFLTAPGAPVTVDPMAKYGSDVRIVQFYSASREIAHGGNTLLCYGVVNAKAVRLDPPVDKVWPAESRCFNVAPAGTTRYTLTAEGADHKTAAESIEIVVKP